MPTIRTDDGLDIYYEEVEAGRWELRDPRSVTESILSHGEP